MRASFLLALSALLPAALAAEAVAPTSCIAKGGPGSYSYDPYSATAPSNWGTLEGFETCGSGSAQSPIDFPTTVSYAPLADGPKPSLMRADMALSGGAFNWALSCPDGADCGGTMFAGKEFKLINLHFHSPSEHTLNGTQFPLEAHMVHISADGSLAVIATMFKYVDEASYAFSVHDGAAVEFGGSPLVKQILTSVTKGREEFPVYLGGVIDANKGYCVYVGSLTTPPCTEGVTFLMSNNVKTVSKRQVAQYLLTAGAGYDGNNRPVQERNGREVTCYVS